MALIDAVHDVITRIPCGQVWTYTEVAEALGFRAPYHSRDVRLVVQKLVRDQQRNGPWWRVVANNGKLIEGAAVVQQAMLSGEGVGFDAEGNVQLAEYGRRG